MYKLPGHVFVGRYQEIEALKAALEDALSGQGRLVMLVGEPGIGKTRTARELAAVAEQRGAQVLWGWCYEEAGAPPYWPWVQPLRAYLQRHESDQLHTQMGPGAADIAEIIPELREKLPSLEPAPPLEPEQARFRLFDSIATFLKNAAQSQPLMLVLDDLHWADKPSLLLLQFLVRQLGGSHLLVVCCYRDVELSRQHPLSEALAQLNRESASGGFERRLLRGLSLEDTGRFIESVSGIRPSAEVVAAIYARTDGNPFFLTEVVRLLSERGELKEEALARPQGINVPAGVREAVGQRLNRRSAQCNRLLSIAAVIGQEFSLGLLAHLMEDLSEESSLEALEEALAAGVIGESLETVGRYQFTHALIREALASEQSVARRTRLHARIAEALEKLYGPDASGHAAELAHHFAESQPVLGSEKLVHYSLLAGERALASYAWEEAFSHFQRGLAAKEVSLSGDDAAKDAETAALLSGLGRAQAATAERHQVQQAVDSLSRAFDYYAQIGDVARAVAVAECPYAPLVGIRTGTAQLIARTLTLVPPDSPQAGRLLSRYGYVLALEEGNQQGAQEAFSRALLIAQHEGDAGLELRTLAEAARVDRFQLRLQESLKKSLLALELARHVDDLRSEVSVRYDASFTLELLGNPEGARRHGAEMLALAERLRDRFWFASALLVLTRLSYCQGDWQAARDFSHRGLAFQAADPRILAYRTLLEYQVGDFAQGKAYLERLVEAMRLNPPGASVPYAYPAAVIPFVARITGDTSRLEVAEGAARTALASPSVTQYIASFARAGLGLLAVLQGDIGSAGEQYPALERWRGTVLGGSLAVIDRLLGLLAHTMGNLDQAAQHFEDALAFCRKGGYRPELAWSLCDYADLLLQRNQPGDRPKAMSMLDEAQAISRELSMRPLMERVVARQAQAEVQPEAPPAYPAGLTQREVEVLRLIALGKSNREIAEALIISLSTVAHHVTNIFNKTGAANRTEAAARAAEHRLLSR